MKQRTKAPLHAFKDEQSGKWGFKNDAGEIVVSPRWRSIYYEFSEGLCPVSDDDKKFGFVNEVGELVIPCQYVSHSYFSEGLVKVQEAETYKIGYINKKGETVIPFLYRKGGDFENGLTMVSSDNGCMEPLIKRTWSYIHLSMVGKNSMTFFTRVVIKRIIGEMGMKR